ncbi:four helix bundle protein [Geobacillus stearothermophilus]|uniref:four helix bundle protein n=1 Tax=Geobacillus stearothermophilus TaxID=1422 RepID=UPI002E1F284A|nr:four helix bundle protein [Geobacillus stearothermophilus]MED4987200.1 four helix bundle protein [Geobacillus stearothermophilus]
MNFTKKGDDGTMANFRNEQAYILAIEVVQDIYRIIGIVPENERSLVDQGVRAINSVILNIAEGFGQIYRGKRVNNLNDALASAMEVMAFLDILLQIGYLNQEEYRSINYKLYRISKRLRDLNNQEIERLVNGEKYTALIGKK